MDLLQKAQEIVSQAVQCDQAGLIFQAVNHYGEGTRLLMQLAENEKDNGKQNVFYERIKQYIDRAEEIKLKVRTQVVESEQVASIYIPGNSCRNGYDKVFGRYLNEQVQELLLEEPLLDERFHFQDLTKFLELVVCKCPSLSYVRIASKPSQIDECYQINTLEGIKDDLDQRLINMSYIIDDMHIEPKIILNTGYIIKLDRGLHYFQFPKALFNLGLCEYDMRNCYESTIGIFKSHSFAA